jgi:hypothetical protein
MSSSDSDVFKALAAPGGFASLTSLPKAVPVSMALFGSSKPKPKNPLPTTAFNFEQPNSPPVKGPTFGSFGQLSKTNGEPGLGFVFDMKHLRQTKPLIESFAAPFNSEVGAVNLSRSAHVSAKETLELKAKSITEKLPLPAGGVFLRSTERDILPRQHEDLSLLDDLVRIEGLLQQWTAGYIDADVEIDVGGSWIEGIYIASIQRKMEVIGKCWKASLEDLDMPRIQAVDGVPRSQAELRVLLRSIKG